MASFEIQRRPQAQSGDVVQRLLAARGVPADDWDLDIARMLPPALKGVDHAAALILGAIEAGHRIVIAGDMDADGACGVAVLVRGLRMLGASSVDFVVPDRFKMGYGLSPALVDAAVEKGVQLLVTVDNGITSVEGVAYARSRGITTVVTDHHLPGDVVPDADALVNPNQAGCAFASKALCGTGVAFYTLLCVRQAMRSGGAKPAGSLAQLMDLVATATVADVVALDYNNRLLVEAGLRRYRSGQVWPGLAALAAVARVDLPGMVARDIGLRVAPRINAAGRLVDITTGIQCLLADDPGHAQQLAAELDALNSERRALQASMTEEAVSSIGEFDGRAGGIVVMSEENHEGVVGLVATRIREETYRPTMAFAPSIDAPTLIKGSGRSIPGVNIRDVLAFVDVRAPGTLVKFGGHAAAAGATVVAERLPLFEALFDEGCRALAAPGAFEAKVLVDAPLQPGELTLETVRRIETAGPWGAGLEEPLFEDEFAVARASTMGASGAHVRYQLRAGNVTLNGVHFSGAPTMKASGRLHCLYRPTINRWGGRESVQLMIERVL